MTDIDIPASSENMAIIREAITKIVMDNMGGCSCDTAYKERDLLDPSCMWHQAGVGIIEDTCQASIEPIPEVET